MIFVQFELFSHPKALRHGPRRCLMICYIPRISKLYLFFRDLESLHSRRLIDIFIFNSSCWRSKALCCVVLLLKDSSHFKIATITSFFSLSKQEPDQLTQVLIFSFLFKLITPLNPHSAIVRSPRSS